MEQRNRYSLIDELTRCSGYDIALMTTFNFDIEYFERAILNPLYARGLKKISIFIDANELKKSIQDVSTCHLGRKYMVNPIEMNGSFHPKLLLLLGKNKAKLIVGSANLTTSGYTSNNEIFNFFEYSSNKTDNIGIINAAIDFFVEINKLSYKQDSNLIREACGFDYYKKSNHTDNNTLLYNTEKSILDQMKERITQNVNEINIVVPYYDQQLMALKELKKAFPTTKVHVYLYKYLSTFPPMTSISKNTVEKIDVFEGFKDNNSYSGKNFYHGKVFIFKAEKNDYVFYGSANCTQSALIRTRKDNGNVECDCFEIGTVGEFDYFIDNLRISGDKNYTSSSQTHDSEQSGLFSFKYGKYDDGIELHFGYSKMIADIIVNIGDLELSYEYTDSELIVQVLPETAQVLSTIFDVSIEHSDITETLRCWYFVPAVLDDNRYAMLINHDLEGIDIDSSGDKFAEDYTKLIDAMNSCVADIEESRKIEAMRNVLQQEREEEDVDESESDDDFVVEDTMPDEARFEHRRFDAIVRLRKQFLRRFIFGHSSIFFTPRNDHKASNKGQDVDETQENWKPRKATTAEKKFERFVKRRIKEVFNPTYIQMINVEHYIGIMEIVFEIFRKYNNVDPVEDIFDTDYVINTRIEFYKHLLEKNLEDTENLENLEDTVLTNCFAVIIENRAIDDSNETEMANRSFLTLIEKKYNLRDHYNLYIYKAIDRGDAAVIKKGYENSCDYIDMLYGYKSNKQLLDVVSNIYKGAKVSISDRKLIIEAQTSDISSHFYPNRKALAEISKYALKYEPIDIVHIVITNCADIRYVKNISTRITHVVRMNSHQWICEIEYKQGSPNRSKPRRIDF